ncbi:MAG: hypothetical protein AB7G76_11215 [Steroidobacteraceae bacterium]
MTKITSNVNLAFVWRAELLAALQERRDGEELDSLSPSIAGRLLQAAWSVGRSDGKVAGHQVVGAGRRRLVALAVQVPSTVARATRRASPARPASWQAVDIRTLSSTTIRSWHEIRRRREMQRR